MDNENNVVAFALSLLALIFGMFVYSFFYNIYFEKVRNNRENWCKKHKRFSYVDSICPDCVKEGE